MGSWRRARPSATTRRGARRPGRLRPDAMMAPIRTRRSVTEQPSRGLAYLRGTLTLQRGLPDGGGPLVARRLPRPAAQARRQARQAAPAHDVRRGRGRLRPRRGLLGPVRAHPQPDPRSPTSRASRQRSSRASTGRCATWRAPTTRAPSTTSSSTTTSTAPTRWPRRRRGTSTRTPPAPRRGDPLTSTTRRAHALPARVHQAGAAQTGNEKRRRGLQPRHGPLGLRLADGVV